MEKKKVAQKNSDQSKTLFYVVCSLKLGVEGWSGKKKLTRYVGPEISVHTNRWKKICQCCSTGNFFSFKKKQQRPSDFERSLNFGLSIHTC
jgi:hypothetical protein